MRLFTRLFEELDSTTSTLEKVGALKKYFQSSQPRDVMWTVLLLTGRKSKRVLTSKNLRDLFLHSTKYPEWLFDESYLQVGDTAETLSLLLSSQGLSSSEENLSFNKPLYEWLEKEIPALGKIKDNDEQARIIMQWWSKLTPSEIFILNKLMTGGFRVGVSERLVVRALAEVYGVATDQIAHRLTGSLDPTEESFNRLVSKEQTEVSFSQPYPFCLAHAWHERTEEGWQPERWSLEWKYDGIRSQVIRRAGEVWIWSRGEELITDSFPDLQDLFLDLPEGSVLDGEILVMREEGLGSFQDLQKRLGRKKVAAATVRDFPVGFMAYDCLEAQGRDLRQEPFHERRRELENLLGPLTSHRLRISANFSAKDVLDLESLRQQAREHRAEGLMIKDWQGLYSVGRKTGPWWKHKVDPLTLDAVLLYAQAGTGKRANLYTDYTFALRKGEELIPFAKAYSGLDQKEIDQLDHWIRRHTKEKFGPVRSLEPHHVFEIGFEGISESTRHKSGIAVRFPRILRWRKDKKVEDADTIETAFKMLEAEAHP